MGIIVNGYALRQALAERGLHPGELAARAGVSGPTLSHALAGRPLAPCTVRRLLTALAGIPPLPGADYLISMSAAEVRTPTQAGGAGKQEVGNGGCPGSG